MLKDNVITCIVITILCSTIKMVTCDRLGASCTDDGDCNNRAICQGGQCQCPPYHLQVDGTSCLPGRLLGFKCTTDSQCMVRVAMSGCVQGVCQCSDGYTPYRRSNCLKAAAIGDTCRTHDQCRTSSRHSYCNFSIPRVLGTCTCSPEYQATIDGRCKMRNLGLGSPCTNSHQCHMRFKGAVCAASSPQPDQHLLQNRITGHRGATAFTTSRGGTVCVCPKGHLGHDDRCIPVAKELGEEPVSLGLRCSDSSQCRRADPHTHCTPEGVCDCVRPTFSCSATNTGCNKHTFQCVASGQCISPHFVCDGVPHCTDRSDESHCDRGQCPPHAFRCPDGRCISQGRVCDGREDCNDATDERNCNATVTGACPQSTFRCRDGTCLPGYVFCNATPSCTDGSDEDHDACILGAPRVPYCPFRCGNGRCRSASVLCSGRDGCGDNTDENNCQVCACSAAL